MRIGRSDIVEQGYLLQTEIDMTKVEKDIKVVIDDRLLSSEHLSDKINMANKITGIIKWIFTHLDTDIFKGLYTALVRPHVEYANQVWCPHLIKDIQAIENVQRRTTRTLP